MYERSAIMFTLSGCLLTGKFMKILMIFEISTASVFFLTWLQTLWDYSSLSFVYTEDCGEKFV